jgi:hypothetical protein
MRYRVQVVNVLRIGRWDELQLRDVYHVQIPKL